MKKIIALFLILTYANYSFATIILMFFNTDNILVVADSKVARLDGSFRSSACKIHSKNGVLIAASGYVKNNKFDIIKSIKQGIGSKIKLDSTMLKSVIDSVKKNLRLEMSNMKKFFKNSYDSMTKDRIVTAFIIGNVANIPTAFFLPFYCRNTSSGELIIDVQKIRSIAIQAKGGFFWDGDIDTTGNPYFKDTYTKSGESQLINAVNLIGWEAKRDSIRYGLPVTAAIMTKSGITWKRNEKCYVR